MSAIVPYREASGLVVVAESKPTRWQRVVAWFSSSRAARWQWYRQQQGGRWARIYYRYHIDRDWVLCGWRPVPSCPVEAYRTSCSYTGDCTASKCNCEVWP